jgi:hypothetical protein
MVARPLLLVVLFVAGLTASAFLFDWLPRPPEAAALPPAGTDMLGFIGEVSVSSRLGQETIALSGTALIRREDPNIQEGVEVVETEIVSLNLAGQSLTGPINVYESGDYVSSGEIRSLQPPPDQFPASSFFDVFVAVAVPISGFRSPSTVHNEVPLHLVPMSGGGEVSIDAWPPLGVTYGADPDAPPGSHCADGIPLLPSLPAEICVTGVSVEIHEALTPTPSATFTPCPEGNCPPPTPTGALRSLPIGCTQTPAPVASGVRDRDAPPSP